MLYTLSANTTSTVVTTLQLTSWHVSEEHIRARKKALM